jgi:hypothetical protein
VLSALKVLQPGDPYIIQQLALATYKSEQPDKLTSLRDARRTLEALGPATSSDAETVGLWGAIHKRLWEQGKSRPDLDEAIHAYERGFYIKRDFYNGINYAFLLDVRASISTGDEATTDHVLARRVRRDLLDICDRLLKSGSLAKEEAYWLNATKVEALLGLGRRDEAETLRVAVAATAPEAWMSNAMNDQLAKLAKLLPSSSN